MPSKLLQKYLAFIIFLACFFIYNLNLAYETSGDTKAAEILPIAIIKYHTLELKNFYNNPPHQYWITQSPLTQKIISSYPIVPGLMAVPIYLTADLAGFDITVHTALLSKISASLITALAVAIMFLVLIELFNKKTATLLTAIFALATNIWTTASRGLWQHGPSLLFINLAFLLLLKSKKQEWYLFGVGLFMGLAIWNRPINFILLAPLGIHILIYFRRSFLKFCLGGIIPAGLLLLYSWIYFGNILSLGQAQSFNFDHTLSAGIMGLLFSPAHGLFIYSPIFIFSFIGMYLAIRKKEKFYFYLSVSIILIILLYAKWVMWWGGWSFGYRLLIETLPGLIILLGYTWENLISKKLFLKVIFIVLLIFSLGTEILGAIFSPCRGWNFPADLTSQEKSMWDIKNNPWVACTNSASFFDPGKRLDILYKKRLNGNTL